MDIGEPRRTYVVEPLEDRPARASGRASGGAGRDAGRAGAGPGVGRRSVRAPDFIEPIVGWRLWHVVETEAGLRLRSPLYRTVWTPRQEMIAACRRGAESALLIHSPRKPRHSVPDERCGCGIYASRTPGRAAAYLSRFFKQRDGVLHRVIGCVSLWGSMVECESGWRASHAYPARIYVPAPRERRLPFVPRSIRPCLRAEGIALGLADYGVPVELTDCTSIRDLAEALGSPVFGPISERTTAVYLS